MSVCSVCQKTVSPGLYGMRIECGHWIHTKHLNKKNPDFEKCPACKGEVDTSAPLIDEQEPLSIEGRDYVKDPPSQGYFKSKSGEPFCWLKKHKPIGWMVHEKQFGMQKMLQSGVTMDDFLDNGYRWKDLKGFRDFQEAGDRGRQALFALRTHAEHFRGELGLQPLQDLQISGRHLVELYGFFFPEKGGRLQVAGGKNEVPWLASELVQMGMVNNDLFGAGLNFLEDYADLKPTDADEEAMKITDMDIDSMHRRQLPPKEKEELYEEPPKPMAVPINITVNYQKPKITRLHGLKRK